MCIYVVAMHGLCNRLSWLCGLYSYNLHKGCSNPDCKVYLKWEPTKMCNGHYSELFKNMDKLVIVKNDNEVPSNIKRYAGQHSVPNVFKMFKIQINSEMEAAIFGLLNFNDNIELKAQQFISKNFKKNTIGMHIRRTDHVGLAKKFNNFTSDEYFYKIIDNEIKKDKDVMFFLAADNRKTQDIYLKKYPHNIIVWKLINKPKDSFRHTTLEDAGMDLCLLSHCKRVEGSFHSSFSRIALMLNINKRGAYKDADAELNKYVFRGYKYKK